MAKKEDEKNRSELIRVAQEAAKEVLLTASVAAAKLSTETALNISYIQKDITEIKDLMKNNYATKEEMKPVKMIAYGLVALVMVAVIGGLMLLLFKTNA